MDRIIQRGSTKIGTLTYAEGATALGSDVVARTLFPGDGDTVEQFECYDSALDFLHRAYEVHCAAAGIEPAARPVKAPEPTEEQHYYAAAVALEADETAYYDSLERLRAASDDDDLPF